MENGFIEGFSTEPALADSTECEPQISENVFTSPILEENNMSLVVSPPEEEKRKSKVTPAEIGEIKSLFIAGESIKKIMDKYNLSSANWIYDRAEKENWWAERTKFLEKKNKLYLDTVLEGQLDNASKIIEELQAIPVSYTHLTLPTKRIV